MKNTNNNHVAASKLNYHDTRSSAGSVEEPTLSSCRNGNGENPYKIIESYGQTPKSKTRKGNNVRNSGFYN